MRKRILTRALTAIFVLGSISRPALGVVVLPEDFDLGCCAGEAGGSCERSRVIGSLPFVRRVARACTGAVLTQPLAPCCTGGLAHSTAASDDPTHHTRL